MTIPPAYPDQPKSIINVRAPGDLSGTLDSTKCYRIDGVVDMGSVSIEVPLSGLTIQGCGFGVSKLITNDTNATLFTGETAGDLFVTNLEIEVTGAGGKVFDLINGGTNAIEFNTVNFNDCTSLGTLEDYRQLLARNVAWVAPADGLEFIGSWSGGLAIVDSIVILLPAGVTLFKAGSGFVVGSSIRSDMNAISVDSTSTIFDFSPTNMTPDAGFSLINFRTSADDGIPNFPSSSVKASFSNCRGIRNTYPGGAWNITEETATTFGSADTLVKMAGTTTYQNLEWFSSSTDNAFVFDSVVETDLIVTGILTFSGTSNNEMAVQIRHWDDSASAYVNIGDEFKATLNSGGRGENLPFRGIVTMNLNDRIETWIKNINGTNSITATLGGDVGLIERPS